MAFLLRIIGRVTALCLLGTALQAASTTGKSAVKGVDFGREIRPILSDNCFTCHGPDDQARKAKLRLDLREGALKPAKSGAFAIVPGKPEESELLKRIQNHDPDEVMPPPKTGKKLTAAQIDLLKRWIAEGAEWQTHWAFEAVKRPASPVVKNRGWARNEVDSFVAQKLESEKIKPAPEADKATLLRRASYDVTGLPPTPQEIDAFLADKSPKAYEKVVDRLLASPRYGENMARYWLDAARYADSHGFHIDSERSIWKWRDWVINAYNENKPFDQFTTEQLAGDLLPNRTTNQVIASGFVRNNMSTGEGGAILEEYQAKYTFDRTETMSTVWLGLTLTCCRCHSHKYDPISHTEYYRMYSFFNNLNESVMDGNAPNPEPSMKLPSPEQAARLAWLKSHIAEAKTNVEREDAPMDSAQTKWEANWREKLRKDWVLTEANLSGTNGWEATKQEDGSLLLKGATNIPLQQFTFRAKGRINALRVEALPHDTLPKKSVSLMEDGKIRISEIELVQLAAGTNDTKIEKPLKFNQAYATSQDGENAPGRLFDGKSDTYWVPAGDPVNTPQTVVLFLSEPIDLKEGGTLIARLRYEGESRPKHIGRIRLATINSSSLASTLNPPKPPAWKQIGPFPSDGLAAGLTKVYPVETNLDFKAGYPGVREETKWSDQGSLSDEKSHTIVDELHGVHGVYYFTRIIKAPQAVTANFVLRADEVFKVWINGSIVKEQAQPATGDGSVRFAAALKEGENLILIKMVNQVGQSQFRISHNLGIQEVLPQNIATILALTANTEQGQIQTMKAYYRKSFSEEYRDSFARLDQYREEEKAVDKAVPTTMVAKENTDRRETFMLTRGEYDKHGDKVTPGVLSILNPWPAGAPTNRLGLTKWLLDANNPLTARVTVNRFWQQYFGVGLVKTVEDFGSQGERPLHPALLDWLASEFMQSGWDVKHIQRLILTSATYRQSSKIRPELLVKDPENRLLARGPRFRLDGEVVRDAALELGGLLVEKQGGKSVKPYEPPGLWEAVSYNNAQKYVQDKGESNYRRSLYTSWKRQSPPPNMMIFDAPSREYCAVRRPRSNTPLQSLVLLNDPQFVEAARAFAQRILSEGGKDTKARLRYGFRLATSRLPSSAELKILEDTLQKQEQAFRQDEAAAKSYLGVGEFKAPAATKPSEFAAWSTIASMLLNLDETISKG